MKIKAKIKIMLLQAKAHQRLLRKHRKLGERHGMNSSSLTSEGTNPDLEFWLPEL